MSEVQDILRFDPERRTETNIQPNAADVLAFDPEKQQEMIASHENTFQPQMMASHGEDRLSWSQALIEGFENIPASAWQYAKDIASSIKHPIATRDALVATVGSGLQNLIPGKQGKEEDFQPILDFYKKRYGSVEGFKEAIANEPVQVLGDLASIVTATGKAAEIGGLTKTGAALQKTGQALEPLNLAKRIAATPIRLLPKELPSKMYQSAVKFGTTLSAKERAIVTNTALENQIMPTTRGMIKLRGMIDDLNQQINAYLNNSPYKGHPVNAKYIYGGLKQIKNQAKLLTDEPLIWDAAYKRIERQAAEALKLRPARSLQEVQRIKVGIYKELESFYEKNKANPARVVLRKATARNARRLLEYFVPEIHELNKTDGALIELWDAVESKANRITNRDFSGLGLSSKVGSGAAAGYVFGKEAGGKVGAVIGATMAIIDTPKVKSALALVIHRLQSKGIQVAATPTLMRLGLFEAAQPTKFQENEE